jgi:hypothetical protein
MSKSMFRKLSIILGACCLLTACGDIYTPPPINLNPLPPVVVNPVPPAPLPLPMPVPPPIGNFVVVQRGFYAGCRGNIVNVYNVFGTGNFYTLNPLYCAFTNTTFFNITLHWSMF